MSNEKKVKKQNKRPRMKKNIKQFSIAAPRIKQMIRESGSWNAESYSVYVTQKQEFLFSMGELNYLANQYGKVKNYVYSRFSGINSLHLLKDYKKSIRDT
ncbi:hypothetical protein [Bacillus sp. OTU530]|uniref:hypothetical protein n=1 Tax=Bacillus sp. OTU530 TaxID=3043862 RepID=UPI00313F3812